MIINWYGEGCFKIQTGGLTIVTDPFSAKGGSASGGESSIGAGLTPPRGKTDIVLKTLTAWPIKEEQEEGTVVRGGGEYEISGVEIRGFHAAKESTEKFFKTVYKVAAEQMTLGFLGHLSEELAPEALQALKDEIDILFIPAGGTPFIDQEKAAKTIKQISPKIVAASFFKVPGLKRSGGDWKTLAKEMDQKPDPMEKLTVRKKELQEQKGTKLVILKI